jgi:hypothetical protein
MRTFDGYLQATYAVMINQQVKAEGSGESEERGEGEREEGRRECKYIYI